MARVVMYRLRLRNASKKRGEALVRKVMTEVLFESKLLAATGLYATGALSESIDMDGPRHLGLLITGSVGSDLPYADAVHNGAKIHPIFPKALKNVYRFGSRKRPQLKFFWRTKGRTVVVPHIPIVPGRIGQSHPGIKHGKHYLSRPLREVGRRNGFKVTTVEL